MIEIQTQDGELVKVLQNSLDGEFGFHKSFGIISKEAASKRNTTKKRNHYDYICDEWLCSFKFIKDDQALKIAALNGCEVSEANGIWSLKTPMGTYNISQSLSASISPLLESHPDKNKWLNYAMVICLLFIFTFIPAMYFKSEHSNDKLTEKEEILEPITITIPKEIKMVRVEPALNQLTTPNMSPTLTGKAEYSRRAVNRNLGFLGMVGSPDVKGAIGGVPQNLKVATAGAGPGGTGGSGGETLTGLGKGLRKTTVGNTGLAGLGGIGTKGGAGGGLGGYGNTLVASGEGKGGISAIAVSNSDMVVEGGISKYAINATIAKYLNQVRRCYEAELKNKPELQGLVEMSFEINAEGRLNFSKVNKSTLASPPVESCISTKMMDWQFPKPKGGVNVPVKYPFMLRPVGN
jgi:hypothetical protein